MWISETMKLISESSGDKFKAGDVLLDIETDKAQIPVEAQDDGIMAKILVLLPYQTACSFKLLTIFPRPKTAIQESWLVLG